MKKVHASGSTSFKESLKRGVSARQRPGRRRATDDTNMPVGFEDSVTLSRAPHRPCKTRECRPKSRSRTLVQGSSQLTMNPPIPELRDTDWPLSQTVGRYPKRSAVIANGRPLCYRARFWIGLWQKGAVNAVQTLHLLNSNPI